MAMRMASLNLGDCAVDMPASGGQSYLQPVPDFDQSAGQSSIIASLWRRPGVKRRRSVPRGTVGKLIGWT